MHEQPLRVLVAEDEGLLAMMVETLLEDAGWQAAALTATVPEALQAVEQGGFDVALLDVNLGGSEVFPVADALLARGVPLVFATGYGSHGVREDLRHLPVVAKPYSAKQLLQALRDAAGRPVVPARVAQV